MLLLFNKPYGVLSDRDSASGRKSIADYVPFPKVEAAGRLDFDSEGLLVLTDDGLLQHQIAHPRHKMHKVYLAQVEGTPSDESIKRLEQGVALKDGPARAISAKKIASPAFPPRDPPAQERRDIGSNWLEITLDEGRKRQIRRMTAAIGHPTLRLIRVAVGPWQLKDLPPGTWREIQLPRKIISK